MSIEVNRLHTCKGHRDGIYTLQPADKENQFFSAAGDGMVVHWNMDEPDQGELIAKLPNSIYAMLYMKERDLLIAAHNYDGVHFLDWKNKIETSSLNLTKAAIFDLQVLDDKLFVATGDGTVIVVDISRLSIINRDKSSEKSARTIAVNHKTGEVAVGYSDNYIRVFDGADLNLKFAWKAHDNSVFSLRYSPDCDFLLSGSRDARFKVWDVHTAYHQAAEVVAHMYAINHIDFSPDGKHFVTCSMDKSIKVWSFEEMKLLKVIDKARHAGHGTSINKLLWTKHHGQLLSASDDRTISSWRINFEPLPL